MRERHDLSPVVFAGTLKLKFSTRPQIVTDSQASKKFARVVVKYGGTDPTTGISRSSTEDLGFVLDYGKQDWQEVALALREFVSNAIDRSIREKGDWSGVKVEIVDEGQVRAKRDHSRSCARAGSARSKSIWSAVANGLSLFRRSGCLLVIGPRTRFVCTAPGGPRKGPIPQMRLSSCIARY